MDNGHRSGKAEVQTIMSMLQAFSHSLKLLAQISDATVSAIDESERYRDAVKRKAHPLDINMLLSVIEKTPTYELTADALKRATVLRFELGRLWVEARDAIDRVRLDFGKSAIREVLRDQFGVDFNVRIKVKE